MHHYYPEMAPLLFYINMTNFAISCDINLATKLSRETLNLYGG
jgi:hypothetical protein